MLEKNEIIVRQPLPGEYGWIVQVHGEYYARKFGWKEEFECIVSAIIFEYLKSTSTKKQNCFIAEFNHKPIGCAMLMESTPNMGKLRVLYVAESMRGRGVGATLINAIIKQAKEFGYKELSLWTTDNQIEARNLYKKIGFIKESESPNVTFAKGSCDEEWKMKI